MKLKTDELNEILSELENTLINKKIPKKKLNFQITTTLKKYEELCKSPGENPTNDSKFYNKFFCEIRPLAVLINNTHYTHITIMPNNHKFDAEMHIGTLTQAVECTTSVDGYQRNLELQHIQEYGSVNPNRKVEKNRYTKASGKKRIIEQEPSSEVAFSKNDMVKKFKNSIENAINKKINKSNEKDAEAILVVSFICADFRSMNDDDFSTELSNINLTNPIFREIHFTGLRENEGDHFYFQKNI